MVNDIAKSLTILKEIKDYILPLSDEEFFNLEKSILLEGCRDPLIAWQKKMINWFLLMATIDIKSVKRITSLSK
jgi:hypothetical protein